LRWISFKAIAVGLAIMFAIDTVIGTAALLLWPGGGLDQAQRTTVQPDFLVFSIVFGSLTTALGGAIAASRAPTLPYWHALIFGGLSMVLGSLMAAPDQPGWFLALAYTTTIPVALLGARAALRRT
jgi:hypothetical protein